MKVNGKERIRYMGKNPITKRDEPVRIVGVDPNNPNRVKVEHPDGFDMRTVHRSSLEKIKPKNPAEVNRNLISGDSDNW